MTWGFLWTLWRLAEETPLAIQRTPTGTRIVLDQIPENDDQADLLDPFEEAARHGEWEE
jgi:hypothetical protein